MFVAVVQKVECIGGCGGGGIPSNAEVIAVAAALASLAVAFYAVKIARGSLSIAEAQHSEFLRELRARADFAIKIKATGGGDVVDTEAGRIDLHWLIEITDVGEKVANHVGINFAVPRELTEFKWVRGDEDSTLTPQIGAHNITGDLIASDGTSYQPQAISKIAERLGRTGRWTKASASVEVPRRVGERKVIPFRLKLRSDDLPDDVTSVAYEDEVVIRRIGPTNQTPAL